MGTSTDQHPDTKQERTIAPQRGGAGDVQRALEQTGGRREKKPVETRHKLWLGGYVLVLAALGVLLYLFGLHIFGLGSGVATILQRFTRGAMFVVLVLALQRLLDAAFICRLDDPVSQYNLRRISKLVAALFIALIVISVIFVNWYAAALSLGLVTAIFGFALQTPIASFLGWIYILVRQPYRVGDRIQIGDSTGDVIDVSYLDTTLWEFGGPYLKGDHPSGRVIKFPNANVLSSAVYNYSWPLFPYIWNEITVQVAYQADLKFVADTMRRIVGDELGPEMKKRVDEYRELLAQTPVDEIAVKEHPVVFFRVSDNTWIEAVVRFLLEAREVPSFKGRTLPKLLEALNARPEQSMFPKGDAR